MATFNNGESGLSVRTKINNVLQHLDGTSGAIVVNDAGADVDFRVESDTNPNALFVDGASGNVGVGTSAPAYPLHVNGRISYSGAIGEGADTTLSSVSTTVIHAASATWQNQAFYTSGIERARIDASGNLLVGTTTNVDSSKLYVIGGISQSGNQFNFRPGSGVQYELVNRVGAGFDFYVNNAGTLAARIDASGNMLVGGTTAGTASAGNLVLFNGTAPTGNVTNGVTLYAEDVSSSSELKVRDEAGNVTTLSPHNFDLIPEGPSEEMAWSYYSERDGKRINVDMLKAIRILEQLSGEKLVHIT